jgi:sterol desaturase/sphingolipid hydroxylase (fatty acid hydroxylase superfamily)
VIDPICVPSAEILCAQVCVGGRVEQQTNLPPQVNMSKPLANFQRKKSDYLWLAGFFATFVVTGEYFYPERSTLSDAQRLMEMCNPFKIENEMLMWAVWTLLTASVLGSLTVLVWCIFRVLDPEVTPATHFFQQLKDATINFFLLASMQTIFDYFSIYYRISKTTFGRDDLGSMVWGSILWVLPFEFAWYLQHRLMHDNKFLWTMGHSYHHQWKRPEHMIGITNFAFDHVIEVWVTMSSAFLPLVLYPQNFYSSRALMFAYMVFAVCVHWEGFQISRYHINHHYLVTKNYGSHLPIFDIFFGTYQSQPYTHPDTVKRLEKKKA